MKNILTIILLLFSTILCAQFAAEFQNFGPNSAPVTGAHNVRGLFASAESNYVIGDILADGSHYYIDANDKLFQIVRIVATSPLELEVNNVTSGEAQAPVNGSGQLTSKNITTNQYYKSAGISASLDAKIQRLNILIETGGTGGITDAQARGITSDSVAVERAARITDIEKVETSQDIEKSRIGTQKNAKKIGFDIATMPRFRLEDEMTFPVYSPVDTANGSATLSQLRSKINSFTEGLQVDETGNVTWGSTVARFGEVAHQVQSDRLLRGNGYEFGLYNMDFVVGGSIAGNFYGLPITQGTGRLILTGQAMITAGAPANGSHRNGTLIFNSGTFPTSAQRRWGVSNTLSEAQNTGFFGGNDRGALAFYVSADASTEPDLKSAEIDEVPQWLRRDGIVRQRQLHTEMVRYTAASGGNATTVINTKYLLKNLYNVSSSLSAIVEDQIDGFGTVRQIFGTPPGGGVIRYRFYLSNVSTELEAASSEYEVVWSPLGLQIISAREGVGINAPRLNITAGELRVSLFNSVNPANISIYVERQGAVSNTPAPTQTN